MSRHNANNFSRELNGGVLPVRGGGRGGAGILGPKERVGQNHGAGVSDRAKLAFTLSGERLNTHSLEEPLAQFHG